MSQRKPSQPLLRLASVQRYAWQSDRIGWIVSFGGVWAKNSFLNVVAFSAVRRSSIILSKKFSIAEVRKSDLPTSLLLTLDDHLLLPVRLPLSNISFCPISSPAIFRSRRTALCMSAPPKFSTLPLHPRFFRVYIADDCLADDLDVLICELEATMWIAVLKFPCLVSRMYIKSAAFAS